MLQHTQLQLPKNATPQEINKMTFDLVLNEFLSKLKLVKNTHNKEFYTIEIDVGMYSWPKVTQVASYIEDVVFLENAIELYLNFTCKKDILTFYFTYE